MGAWVARGMIQQGKDFDIPYPLEKDLILEEGWLTEGKGKAAYFLFKSENGSVQRLHPSGVFDFLNTGWFRSESDWPVWRRVKVAWFKMPSGTGWLASIELEGKPLAGYEQRKHDFLAHKWIRDHHFMSRVLYFSAQYLYYIGAGLIFIAYLVAWVQIRQSNHDFDGSKTTL